MSALHPTHGNPPAAKHNILYFSAASTRVFFNLALHLVFLAITALSAGLSTYPTHPDDPKVLPHYLLPNLWTQTFGLKLLGSNLCTQKTGAGGRGGVPVYY